ncbi:MAG: patatin-like phospholipase family protein, partial [Gemmatimonadales bacterium]
MRLRLLSLAAAGVLVFAGRHPAAAQTCEPGPTALVLSGGGVKGLAHLGVLAALDSLGVRPDLIVGTSMGAIVGAMYASGYSARQIDSLARGLPISEIVRPFRVPAPHPWDERLPILFMVRGQRGFEFQTGIVDEAQPNARLNTAMLSGNLLARGRFDRLPIPFRAVATDLRNRHTVVISEGDLARAVRASSAIPLVFPPVVAGRAILVDGGLSANIPITEARLAGAGRVIVSDVTEHPAENLDPESPIEMADQLLNFLFQQPTGPLGEGDVFIRPDVQEYRSLDFAPETVEEILRRGRAAADTTLTRARCLPTGARPPVPAPPSTLSGWSVRRGVPGDSVLLGRILGLESGPIDAPELRRRLLGLADAEAYRGVWLNPAGTGDSVTFGVEPIRAPRMVGGMGLAYDQDLGGRVWLGIFDRRLLGSTVEASAVGSAGSHQQALEGSLSWHAGLGASGVSPILTARIRNESVLRFDSAGADLPSRGTSDARMQAGLEVRLGEAWRLRITGDVVAWGTASTRGAARPGGS